MTSPNGPQGRLSRSVEFHAFYELGRTSPLVRLFLAARETRDPWARFVVRRLRSNPRLMASWLVRRWDRPETIRVFIDGEASEARCAAGADFLLTYLTPSGGYEPDVSALLAALVGPRDVVFDIGANCGYHSLQVAGTPGFRGQIHAFEVTPEVAASLADMVAQLGLARRIHCHEFGLSDAAGEVRLERGARFGNALNRVAGAGGGRGAGQVRRLDDLDLPAPHVVKMDVEGHEPQVLAGARRTLSAARPHIIFESNRGEAALATMGTLEDLGYVVFRPTLDRAAAGKTRLHLTPLDRKARRGLAGNLNLLAVHTTRRAALAKAFGAKR